MVSEMRQWYNSTFTQEKYLKIIASTNPFYDTEKDFRLAETPVFVSKAFKSEMMQLFGEIKEVLESEGFSAKMDRAVPSHLRVANEDPAPVFVVIDFAVCKDSEGRYFPQIIEMQGIASLYCYQRVFSNAFLDVFGIEKSHFSPFYEGYDDLSYVSELKKAILADQDPEQVILLEIDPWNQKTRIDFYHTKQDIGIEIVDINHVWQKGRELFYQKGEKNIPIKRIYNRVIFDEFERRKDLELKFDIFSDLDVKWMSHPNWFFKISKFSLPFIKSRYVPDSQFLSEIKTIPSDLENYVLKPLFSFAGAGVIFDVKPEDIASISDPENYILQRKVNYEAFIPTPNDTPAKAEIRMMCLWDEKGLKPIFNLARLSKGKMLGVDFNKERDWVGASAVLFEQ
jgi:hypothetical protein